MEKTWKPVAGGICSIVGGSFAVIGGGLMGLLGAWFGGFRGMWGGMWGPGMMTPWGSGMMMPWGSGLFSLLGLPAILLGVVAIVGGIFALRRRHWGLALAGAICAIFTPASFVLGAVATVFVALARDEFER
jgi:hypothetical protein